MVGGQYPDGYDDTEVEVWSLDPDCDVHIKNTKQAFIDRPAVAVLENNIYVCGLIHIGLNQTWTEGAPLKFNQPIDNDNNHVDYQGLKMTTMGSTLIAVYRKSPNYPEETYFQISTLSESGWSEPICLNKSNGEITYNTEEEIAVDERHIASKCRC